MEDTFNPNIQKLYIESSTLCNLDCTMCMRKVWKDEKLGHMDMDIYRRVIKEAADIPSIHTVFFGGVGEPTFHPNFAKMVKLAHEAGKRVECVTNGTLLNRDYIKTLAANGLNQIWISVDGFSKENYEGIRHNSDYDLLKKNMRELLNIRITPAGRNLQLGLTFVAMKSNIGEVESLIRTAWQFNANDVKITHILPYSEEAVNEALYWRTLDSRSYLLKKNKDPDSLYWGYMTPLHIDFPFMDVTKDTLPAIGKLLNSNGSFSIMGEPFGRQTDYCRFVHEGNVFVKWDGTVTQCMALLHPSETYLGEYKREIHSHSFGDLRSNTLMEIWNEPEYAAFRQRVRDFDFSMCTGCASCDLIESNQEDCIGNTLPSCGGCLWAQGFIQCP